MVLDGATLDLNIDLGFGVAYRTDFTLVGVGVMPGEEQRAKERLISFVGGHRVIVRMEPRKEVCEGEVFVGGLSGVEADSEVVGGSRLWNVNKLMRGFSSGEIARG